MVPPSPIPGIGKQMATRCFGIQVSYSLTSGYTSLGVGHNFIQFTAGSIYWYQ